MHWLDGGSEWVRWGLQRGLALCYLLAFWGAWKQFLPLLGEQGLLPISHYLKGRSWRQTPTLFHLGCSDRRIRQVMGAGLVLSLLTLTGLSEAGPCWLSTASWLSLWILYGSLVNAGQTFYGFGWESMQLEAGFYAAFLGPAWVQPNWVALACFRWMLFRLELGAGLIKLRHDRCWRDFTCLDYHYETQPLPNRWSWHFHHLPRGMHSAGVLASHLVQVVAPFLLLAPQPLAGLAGLAMIAQQCWLAVSGNYASLSLLSSVLALCALPGPSCQLAPRPWTFELALLLVAGLVLGLSGPAWKNLWTRHQRMNHSYNVLRLVNSYGAFGGVNRERIEVILEGSSDLFAQNWQEYEFWAKPGNLARRPPQIAPYHLRLDWCVWFLPLGPRRKGHYDTWFVRLVQGLLRNHAPLLALLRYNPFPDRPPLWIRARLFRYRFTSPQEKAASGLWWQREEIGTYLPAYGLP